VILLGTGPNAFSGVTLTDLGGASIPDDLGGQSIPNWSGGGLINLRDHQSVTPLLTVYDSKGRTVSTVAFTIPDAIRATISGFSHGANGTIAICGEATDAEGRTGHLIAWVGADGQSQRIVRTDPYRPIGLAVASDGTIWTTGYEYLSDNRTLNPAAQVIRRWNTSGEMVGGYVPQTEFTDVRASVIPTNYFVAGGDRVALFSDREGRYLEISLSGNVTAISGLQLPGGRHHVIGMALTSDGETLVSCFYPDNRSWAVVRLDAQNKQWIPVTSGQNPPVHLYGSDGNQIVGKHGGPPGSFRFFTLSK
jgi:hypothetical protein